MNLFTHREVDRGSHLGETAGLIVGDRLVATLNLLGGVLAEVNLKQSAGIEVKRVETIGELGVLHGILNLVIDLLAELVDEPLTIVFRMLNVLHHFDEGLVLLIDIDLLGVVTINGTLTLVEFI